MGVRSVLVVFGLLATCIQAYSPLHFMNKIVMPNGFVGRFKGMAPPQQLIVTDPSESMSSGMIPYFSAKLDHTITWDDMGWCVEASGLDSVIVQLNRCSGGPMQQWNWIPDGHGRDTIQLMNSNRCLDVTGTGLVELRECADRAMGAWKFEETNNIPTQVSSWMRYVIVSLIALAGIGALSLRFRTKARGVAFHHGSSSWDLEHGAISLTASGETAMATGSCPPSTHMRLGDVSMTAARAANDDDPTVAGGEAALLSAAAVSRRVVLASAAAGLVSSANVVPASAESTMVTRQQAYTRYVPRIERSRDFWAGPLLKYVKASDWANINKELEPIGRKGRGGALKKQFSAMNLWASSFSGKTIADKTIAMRAAVAELEEATASLELAAAGEQQGGFFGFIGGKEKIDEGKRGELAIAAHKKGVAAFNKFIEVGNDGLGSGFSALDSID